jgi:hypothetical protein
VATIRSERGAAGRGRAAHVTATARAASELQRRSYGLLTYGISMVRAALLDPNFAVSGAFWKYLVHDRVFIRAARA